MRIVMPQEIEVWYLLPALRKELTTIFIDNHQMKQKEAAKLLGLTEAAISQYRKDKRAKEDVFTHQEKHLYDLCRSFRGSNTICNIHRAHDQCFPDKCDICSQE